MTAIETAKAVLAKASLLDQTFANPDLGIAVAWAEILGDINTADACSVVAAHYSRETRRIMPADIIAGVHRIRSERIKADMSDPVYDGDDVAGGLAAIRAHRRAVGDGTVDPKAALPSNELRARAVQKLIRQTADRLPKIPDEPDAGVGRSG